MELDDLRYHWRKADEPPAEPLARMLQKSQTRQSSSLLKQMRRNVWLEITIVPVLALLGLLVLIAQHDSGLVAGYSVLMGSILVLSGILYYRQIKLLKQTMRTDLSVRTHLQFACVALRQLLHLYYRLTFYTGPVTLLALLGYLVSRELSRPAGPHWAALGLVASVILVTGVVVQIGVVYATRWFLQRLYGRHLDRLENQLRELDEQAPASAG
ncbi:hypothetical protein [Hymenobacter sp. BRD67]|uniref:hypothetical protein n=1 Tax=Hymenobacter sp. BRD67 TaxID=2675877 RepID=UPI00156362A1|nr:hypothetical protein [Hymenobacter sp. BRD67]QKG51652.1 hypothetical protein GKZ67_02375 [Hymenobacter sp. BRD67]